MRALWCALALVLALDVGCSRQPTEADCRKAIENIDRVTAREADAAEQAAAVRKCQSSASRSAVSCWQNAKTPDDLERCEGPSKAKK